MILLFQRGTETDERLCTAEVAAQDSKSKYGVVGDNIGLSRPRRSVSTGEIGNRFIGDEETEDINLLWTPEKLRYDLAFVLHPSLYRSEGRLRMWSYDTSF